MRKVCVITGTRAEYGLLYWLMKGIQSSKKLELQTVVTGMHLSPEFGLTYQQIEQDGFTINKKVEMLLSSDSEVGITKSMGVGLIGFADVFNDLSPDLVVVLGDRFEIFVAVIASMIAKIPVAHLHGGEITEGAFDDAIRHSITKMSYLHFTSTIEHYNRVIQLGEQTDRVFNVGAIGVDNIKRFNLLSKEEFEKSINFKLGKRNLIVTFHPVTLENATSEEQFSALLSVLEIFSDVHIIFTKSNADTNGRVINEMIDDYVNNHTETTVAFISLGQLRYLSAMQYVDGVVGNSSSGIIEAPSFKIGTINIGDRQRGRISSESIIHCSPAKQDIVAAFQRLFSDEFSRLIENIINPYECDNSVEKIMGVIKKYPLKGDLKKRFNDL